MTDPTLDANAVIAHLGQVHAEAHTALAQRLAVTAAERDMWRERAQTLEASQEDPK